MSVGVFDADYTTYTKVVFNLELMKLSAYYKRKGEIVILAPEFAPEKHTKFIYWKDYEDGIYPNRLTTTPNVQYGGLAFSNNIYQPLPLEIERMRPDTELYRRAEASFLSLPGRKKDNELLFNALMKGEHLRLSLDGKTIWGGYESQLKDIDRAKHIILHDYNLGAIDGSFEIVKDLASRATFKRPTKIGMKFPVQIQDGDSLLKWASLAKSTSLFFLQYNGVIPNDIFMEWVKCCTRNPSPFKIDYNVTPSWYDQNDFITNLLPQIFRQAIILQSYSIDFSLKYDNDFFTDKRWIEVLELIVYFIKRLKAHEWYRAGMLPQGDETLFSEIKYLSTVPKNQDNFVALDIPRTRELFDFVRENNYPLFKDFYECSANSLGGTL